MDRGEALRFWRSKCDFFDMARCHRAVGSVVLVICLEINENIVHRRGFSGSHTMLSVRKLAGSQGWLGQLTAQKCRFRGVQQRELDQDPHFCHPRAPSEACPPRRGPPVVLQSLRAFGACKFRMPSLLGATTWVETALDSLEFVCSISQRGVEVRS